jgi:hypothetical protein
VATETAWIEHIGQSPDDPVIWQGRLCDALSKWRHLSYFEEMAETTEPIVVDVETMGGRYNDPDAERIIGLPLTHYLHYLRQYIISSASQQQQNQNPQQPPFPVLYLAQNDIPSVLLPDIGPWPTVCTTRTTTLVRPDDDNTTKSNTTATPIQTIISEGKLYGTNWWMGPIGSGSPLHTDPLANALLQMVGHKDVALLNGKQHSSDMLYAGSGSTRTANTTSRSSGPPTNPPKMSQGNTSPIDVFGCLPGGDDAAVPSSSTLMIERARYPEFFKPHNAVVVQTATLQPGDVLYIPPLCWHTTRTSTTKHDDNDDDDDDDNDFTISVNAWWR